MSRPGEHSQIVNDNANLDGAAELVGALLVEHELGKPDSDVAYDSLEMEVDHRFSSAYGDKLDLFPRNVCDGAKLLQVRMTSDLQTTSGGSHRKVLELLTAPLPKKLHRRGTRFQFLMYAEGVPEGDQVAIAIETLLAYRRCEYKESASDNQNSKKPVLDAIVAAAKCFEETAVDAVLFEESPQMNNFLAHIERTMQQDTVARYCGSEHANGCVKRAKLFQELASQKDKKGEPMYEVRPALWLPHFTDLCGRVHLINKKHANPDGLFVFSDVDSAVHALDLQARSHRAHGQLAVLVEVLVPHKTHTLYRSNSNLKSTAIALVSVRGRFEMRGMFLLAAFCSLASQV
ncbi:MAG: hypothetical protein MHM6MM_000529 [Cercozoa sp. M6MM]